jgi:hypothetical protein
MLEASGSASGVISTERAPINLPHRKTVPHWVVNPEGVVRKRRYSGVRHTRSGGPKGWGRKIGTGGNTCYSSS